MTDSILLFIILCLLTLFVLGVVHSTQIVSLHTF
jgi:hypothetical protein